MILTLLASDQTVSLPSITDGFVVASNADGGKEISAICNMLPKLCICGPCRACDRPRISHVREAESDHAAWSCVYSLSRDVDSLWGAALEDLVCWRCPSSWCASLPSKDRCETLSPRFVSCRRMGHVLKPEIDRTVSSWVYSLLRCVDSFVGWLAGMQLTQECIRDVVSGRIDMPVFLSSRDGIGRCVACLHRSALRMRCDDTDADLGVQRLSSRREMMPACSKLFVVVPALPIRLLQTCIRDTASGEIACKLGMLFLFVGRSGVARCSALSVGSGRWIDRNRLSAIVGSARAKRGHLTAMM
jgi:hypothetical protein